ncbi:formylglycine-generating enzyme family protein, partial [Singulisphaera rosea]
MTIRLSKRHGWLLIIGAAITGGTVVSSTLWRRPSSPWPQVTKGEPKGITPEPSVSGKAEGMEWIPAGTFWRGSTESPDAQPVHEVELDGFWLDRTEVTNAQFAAFVKATGYMTVAERAPAS